MIREVLRRLFGTSLFIEALSNEEVLIVKLAFDTMSVEFPNPKDFLAKKRAQKEAAKAATVVNIAQGNEPLPLSVIESSLEPPIMPEQSPSKKRKANEKPRRKVPAKTKKTSNASISEKNDELRTSEQDN